MYISLCRNEMNEILRMMIKKKKFFWNTQNVNCLILTMRSQKRKRNFCMILLAWKQDGNEIFGRYVASELRSITENQVRWIKWSIQNMLQTGANTYPMPFSPGSSIILWLLHLWHHHKWHPHQWHWRIWKTDSLMNHCVKCWHVIIPGNCSYF